jgi:hypothetical protein
MWLHVRGLCYHRFHHTLEATPPRESRLHVPNAGNLQVTQYLSYIIKMEVKEFVDFVETFTVCSGAIAPLGS